MLTEHQEQSNFVQWLEIKHPAVRLFAIPNGGLRNKVVAAKLKREGVRPGVPDVFIPGLHLFIEFKRVKGSSTSAYQKDWIAYLKEIGYRVEVCKGCDDAINVIKQIYD